MANISCTAYMAYMANARAKYRDHSYRRRCHGTVEASSQNSKTTFSLRVTGKECI